MCGPKTGHWVQQIHTTMHSIQANTIRISNIPFLAPIAKKKESRTRKEKSRFHTHPDTSVAIMADRLSLNISHFYNTERGNTDNLDCFPWTSRREMVASHAFEPEGKILFSEQNIFFRSTSLETIPRLNDTHPQNSELLRHQSVFTVGVNTLNTLGKMAVLYCY